MGVKLRASLRTLQHSEEVIAVDDYFLPDIYGWSTYLDFEGENLVNDLLLVPWMMAAEVERTGKSNSLYGRSAQPES